MSSALMRLAALCVLALVAGCSTLNEKECLSDSWYNIGLRDGANGRPEHYIAEHAAACQKYAVAPNHERWLEGRQRGLESYCTVRNGLRVGEAGGSYEGVCVAPTEQEFLRGYELGLEINRLGNRLDAVRGEIRKIESTLADKKKDLTEKERDQLVLRLREYEYQRGALETDYDRLQWRARGL